MEKFGLFKFLIQSIRSLFPFEARSPLNAVSVELILVDVAIQRGSLYKRDLIRGLRGF